MTDLPEKPAAMPLDMWEAALARRPQPFSEAGWRRQIVRDWDVEELARILYDNGEAQADTDGGRMLAWEEIRDLVSIPAGDAEPKPMDEPAQWAWDTRRTHRHWAELLVGLQPDDSDTVAAIMARAAAAARASTVHLGAAPQEYPPGEYAIVELFGHSTLVGRISEIERFGTKMMAMEPLFAGQLLAPVYHGGASIYRLTPCSAAIAFAQQPRDTWQLPLSIRCTIPAALLEAPAATLEAAEVEEPGADAPE